MRRLSGPGPSARWHEKRPAPGATTARTATRRARMRELRLASPPAVAGAAGRAGAALPGQPSTHLCELLVVRCFLLWAREQGRIAADRDVIRVILQGWNSRRKGPPLPGGPGQGLAAGDVGTAGREKSSPAGAGPFVLGRRCRCFPPGLEVHRTHAHRLQAAPSLRGRAAGRRPAGRADGRTPRCPAGGRARGPQARHQVLTAARAFLRRAAEQGLHPLPPEVIYEELRDPGALSGIAGFIAARRHQPSPSPGAMPGTLASLGYPPGVAGLGSSGPIKSRRFTGFRVSTSLTLARGETVHRFASHRQSWCCTRSRSWKLGSLNVDVSRHATQVRQNKGPARPWIGHDIGRARLTASGPASKARTTVRCFTGRRLRLSK